MVVELGSYVALEENPDQQLLHDDDDPYEAVETLSFCDLPTQGDSAHWDDFSKEYQSSSFDRDEDNFFEFFSEEFTAPSTYTSENKDIIFCGKKLIPYINEASHVAEEKKKTKKNNETRNKSSTKKWGWFRWRRFRRSKPKVVAKYSKASQVKDGKIKSNTTSFPMSKRRCDPSLWKVSVLSSSRSKSKWHLFMFGITKYPTEMELRDIKNRQSRRNPSTMFRAKCEASNEITGKGNKEISSNNSSSSSSRAKGFWGLLRAIGCSSQLHRNSVAF